MKGRYQIIGVLNDGPAWAAVGEDVFSMEDSTDEFMVHEIKLTVGHSVPFWLTVEEIAHVIEVLEKARSLARRRKDEFDASEVPPTV